MHKLKSNINVDDDYYKNKDSDDKDGDDGGDNAIMLLIIIMIIIIITITTAILLLIIAIIRKIRIKTKTLRTTKQKRIASPPCRRRRCFEGVGGSSWCAATSPRRRYRTS